MRKNAWISFAAVAATALLVSACGGGSDDTFGAIAYSESTTNASIVAGAENQSVANEAARDKCGAADCVVVQQFSRCGAIAAALDKDRALIVSAEEGATAAEAQTGANNICTAGGGLGCGPLPELPAQCN